MPCSFVKEIIYSPIQNLIFTEDVKNVDFPVDHLQNLIKRDLFNCSRVVLLFISSIVGDIY